jgi:hypothetical protein
MPKRKKKMIKGTNEVESYLHGLFHEFQGQLHKYHALTGELMSLESRIELAEKMVCLTRDHLAMATKESDSTMPRDWDKLLSQARFVGLRLADSCLEVLRERKRAKPEELRDALNDGTYRFRTSAPLREIHAALLKQTAIKKVGETWIYVGEPEPSKTRVVSPDEVTSGDGQKLVAG